MDLKSERKRSLWRRVVDFALSDVNTIVDGGIDDAAIERLEQVLLEADFGVDTTMELVSQLERAAERGRLSNRADLRTFLGERIAEVLDTARGDHVPEGLALAAPGPTVLLVVGVNGTGKTTSVAKLARQLKAEGRRVLLAAADTFRAGAQEQLSVWAGRVGAEFVGGRPGADPAAVAYDAVEAAISREADYVIIDTAGRLHTQTGLMDELEKIDRVISRRVDGAPHERLLVVDATSGQNVLAQAREFGERLPLTGLILTKFDSTARAGTAVAVARELDVPVRFLGTGEGLDELEPFDTGRYVERVLADG